MNKVKEIEVRVSQMRDSVRKKQEKACRNGQGEVWKRVSGMQEMKQFRSGTLADQLSTTEPPQNGAEIRGPPCHS